ncbi:MAG: alpha/beta fold hydrolase [Gammaproteobacteria bacterium]
MLNNLNWIVISGGPGMSNSYLKYALRKLPTEWNLHFYDLYGSPESKIKSPTLDQMIGQVDEVVIELGLKNYGLITHSFGNYLAMRALEKNGENIDAILMLSPMPFEFRAWKASQSMLAGKVPQTVLDKISKAAAKKTSNKELFRLIYPYYTGRNIDSLPVDVMIDINACNLISDKVIEYDDRELVKSTTTPLVRVVGDKDIFYGDHDLLQDKTIVIPEVGHFPFFENPEVFYQAVRKAEKLLS